MEKINVNNPIDILKLKEKYSLEKFALVDMRIGYDYAIYLLFSESVPERIE